MSSSWSTRGCWITIAVVALLLVGVVMVVGAKPQVSSETSISSQVRPDLRDTSSVTMAPMVTKVLNPLVADPLICNQVKNMFASRQLESTAVQLIPDIPHNGHDLEICTSHSSCCTKELVERFPEAITKDFLNVLQTTSSYLKNLIATNVARSQESFLAMVRTSENNTNALFSDIYKRMSSQAQPLIKKMYGGLTDYLKGSDIDLEQTVSAFFDGLFPLVYHHSINPKLTDFNDDYKECLQETQAEIRPFGDSPTVILALVSRSFQAARTFLDALNLGVEVINSTNHLEIATECQQSLIKLLYCPICRGMVSVRSCNGYCMNVVRGCLANMAEVDQPWSDYVTALEKLAASMKGGSILEDVTSSLDAKISEAIMYAMENGPELSKKVKGACGHPKRTTRDVQGSMPFTNITGRVVAVHTINQSLRIHLQNFVHGLVQSKNFYGTLADTLCNDDSLAVRSESNCWNGDAIGEYGKTIAGVGLSAQKYNPELKLQHWRDSKIAQLTDKLKHMRQIIVSRTVTLPESDSMVINDGSGSGYPVNNIDHRDDDEDYNDGSGSGNYPDGSSSSSKTDPEVTDDKDLVFTTGEEKVEKKPSTVSPGKSGAISVIESWSSLTVLLILCGCVNFLNG